MTLFSTSGRPPGLATDGMSTDGEYIPSTGIPERGLINIDLLTEPVYDSANDKVILEPLVSQMGSERFTVLDVGCGGCAYTGFVADRLRPFQTEPEQAVRTIGVDISRKALSLAKSGDFPYVTSYRSDDGRLEDPREEVLVDEMRTYIDDRFERTGDISEGFERLDVRNPIDASLLHASSTTLPLTDESCDVVLANHILYHLDSARREDTLEEVGRVLRDGGFFGTNRAMYRKSDDGFGLVNGLTEYQGVFPIDVLREYKMRDGMFPMVKLRNGEREMRGTGVTAKVLDEAALITGSSKATPSDE